MDFAAHRHEELYSGEVSMTELNGRRLFFVSNDECRNLPQSAAEDMNCLEAVEVWKLDMLG